MKPFKILIQRVASSAASVAPMHFPLPLVVAFPAYLSPTFLSGFFVQKFMQKKSDRHCEQSRAAIVTH